MMIGVAQVIGMKPTLRFVFSSGAPCAKTSVAVLSGKNCESAASAVEAPSDFRKARRGDVLRKHRPHDGRGHDAFVLLLVAFGGGALQLRPRFVVVLALRGMLAADAARQ